MRIGIDARMYKKEGTGISRYIKELVDHVVEADKYNTYVLFLSKEMYGKYIPQKNVEIVCADAKYYSIKEQLIFWKTLYKAKLDLMHFTHFNSPLLYFGKTVVTIHDITLSKFPGQKMNTWIYKMAYKLIIWSIVKKAKHIITVSDHTKKDVIELFNIPEERFTTTYLGVDTFVPRSEKQKEKIEAKYNITKTFLLYVGVWRNHKNILHLIDAFNALRKKGHDVQLVMTGKESPYYPEIRNAIEALDNKDDVITPGFVSEEDLHDLLSAATMLVNPSFYEGFGIPPLEAMASKTLVAVSNVTSHPEVCGDAALYFDPCVLEDIVSVIEKGLLDKDLQKEMINKGYKHTRNFKWKNTAEQTLKVYKSLI